MRSQDRYSSNISGGNSINSSFIGAPGFGGTATTSGQYRKKSETNITGNKRREVVDNSQNSRKQLMKSVENNPITGRKAAYEFRTVASSNSKGIQNHEKVKAEYVSSFTVVATPSSAMNRANQNAAFLPQNL